MTIFNGFNNRQYQLPVCCKDKHRSLKSRKVNDLFLKRIAYNPMLFRKSSRYPIQNQQKIRWEISY